jgi:alpha-amylase/alpha-mannosidase (GH57 family)
MAIIVTPALSSAVATQSQGSLVSTGVYITMHGHFYQPPRENPYLNAIETQEGAAPFHDWNQRIHSECYRPNAFARILNSHGKLLRIVNNFEYLSFNIGATLLSWLEQYDPEVYQRILDGDKASADRLNGHGNAIGQVYNHIIMPLANYRDKITQIRWGKEDFRSRFGRETAGMWLAETAVDYPTLEALISEGIKFIILAPSQAQRCRPQNSFDRAWTEVSGGQIDPNRPYRCHLDPSDPNSAYIDIFFYDGPISRDMGFSDLLHSSHNLAARLGRAVKGDRRSSQLISVATDGETFGHHKHFTEKSIAYAFTEEFPRRGWQVTNYAHYLSLFPPTWEVEIKPVTAWSCAHGVDRWQDDCGCGADISFGKWRKSLRQTLNWLRDRLELIFNEAGAKYFTHPWAARDGYIQVLKHSLRQGSSDLDSINYGDTNANTSHKTLDDFLATYINPIHTKFGAVSAQAKVDALRLLEMQRHALLMFTSCGWFFEELSRPEGVQILRYAARAIELAADVTGILLEAEFVQRLALCPSNVEEFGNGAEVYRALVVPFKITLKQVAADYAVSSLFNNGHNYDRNGQQLYCYTINQLDYQLERIGAMALAIGHIQLTSTITLETVEYVFAVLHLGGYDFHCGIKQFNGRREYEEIKVSSFATLKQASAASMILTISKSFGDEYFNLQDLFAEERHRILHLLSGETLLRLDQLYAQVYRDNYGILASFRRDGLVVPQELQVAAEITLNHRLLVELKSLEGGVKLPIAELDAIAKEANHIGCNLDRTEAAKILEGAILNHLWQLVYSDKKSDVGSAGITRSIDQIEQVLDLAERLKIFLNLNHSQELYLSYLTQATIEEYPNLATLDVTKLLELGERMGIACQI